MFYDLYIDLRSELLVKFKSYAKLPNKKNIKFLTILLIKILNIFLRKTRIKYRDICYNYVYKKDSKK